MFRLNLKPTKQPGNSLTFLLTTTSIISFSLAGTTLMGASLMPQQVNTSYKSEGIEAIAEKHLDSITQALYNNPALLSTSNWGAPESASLDGIPVFQRLTDDAFEQTFPHPPDEASIGDCQTTLRLCKETIQINDRTVEIQSEMQPSLTPGHSSILRFAAPNSENIIRISVKTSAVGLGKIVRSRLISLDPGFCAVQRGMISEPADIPRATLPGSFQIGKITDAAMELGDQRIYWLPHYGNPDLQLARRTTTGVLDLLYGARDTLPPVVFDTESPPTRNLVSLLHGGAPENKLHLDYIEADSVVNDEVILTNVQDTTPEHYTIDIFKLPIESGAAYKGLFLRYDAVNQKVYWDWDSWSAASAPGKSLFSSPSSTFDANEVFEGIALESFAYHAPTRMAVAATKPDGDPTQRVIRWKTVDPKLDDANAPPYIPDSTGEKTSDDPTAISGASPIAALRDAASATFGTPVISQGGDFIVAPVQADTDVIVVAYNTNSTHARINANNYPDDSPGAGSNIATLITYAGININDLHITYNRANNKFYFLAQGADTLYEWDPDTWGAGPPSGSANTWITRGQQFKHQMRDMSIIGNVATTDDEYTGNFKTVRKIGPMPGTTTGSLWSGGEAPQLLFSQVSNTYFLKDGQYIHEINLRKGYLHNRLTGVDTQGRILSLDPFTGWLFYTTTGGLHAYHPKAFNETSPSLSLSPDETQLKALTFGDNPAAGDGNVFFAMDRQNMYYIDAPASGTLQSTAYQPYCAKSPYSLSGYTPGFTKLGDAWSLYETWD